MPASGKSKIGKMLASQMGFDFFDLDKEITNREQSSIPEIFEEKGEAYFRQIERLCLLDLIKKEQGFILATGGGAPCFFDNMDQMNNHKNPTHK
jgi:shikimate kinase